MRSNFLKGEWEWEWTFVNRLSNFDWYSLFSHSLIQCGDVECMTKNSARFELGGEWRTKHREEEEEKNKSSRFRYIDRVPFSLWKSNSYSYIADEKLRESFLSLRWFDWLLYNGTLLNKRTWTDFWKAIERIHRNKSIKTKKNTRSVNVVKWMEVCGSDSSLKATRSKYTPAKNYCLARSAAKSISDTQYTIHTKKVYLASKWKFRLVEIASKLLLR